MYVWSEKFSLLYIYKNSNYRFEFISFKYESYVILRVMEEKNEENIILVL